MDRIQDDNNRRLQIQAEAEVVLDDPTFRRSPTLSALLRYLVSETVAGHGEDLKSYTIAVDGLGRSENFDPLSDSSARVQMVRLRKALEAYYAKNAPSDQLCLYLQPGSYLVRIATPSVAYPALYRLQDNPPVDAAAKLATSKSVTRHTDWPRNALTEAKPNPDTIQIWLRRWRGSTGIAAGIIIALLVFVGYQFINEPAEANLRPVLKIMPIATGNDPELLPLASQLRDYYETDLPRFKIARIRISSHRDRPNEQEEAYRLNTRLVDAGAAGVTLYVSLDESSTDTLVWTRSVVLPVDPVEASNQLIPLMGDIMGPAGAVALHDAVLKRDNKAGGYPCMLKFFEYIRTRSPRLEALSGECLRKPVKEQAIAASILGMRAMFEVERSNSLKNPKRAAKRGLWLAKQAIDLEPTDAWANFAMATLSYMSKDCPSAVIYTSSTFEQNPSSPVFAAALATLAPSCNYPDARALLDHALLVQSPSYVRARFYLAYAALSQNRIEKLAEIKRAVPPETPGQQRYYYVTEALISAGEGRREEAMRHWRTFNSLSDPQMRTPEEKLVTVMATPESRKKIIEFLKGAGLRL